jgi:colicin import membrane protein
MAERQETSVMVSIQEILRDAQNREEQEKLEAEQRARQEEQRRLDEARRRQEEEQARIRAEEAERQRRAFEEQKRQAEIQALQEAAIQKARTEAESQARLAEMTARQEHERHLHALNQDQGKKRLRLMLGGAAALLLVVAVGGGVAVKNSVDKANAAEAHARELQTKIDDTETEMRRVRSDLENAKDPEKIAELTSQLNAMKKERDRLEAEGAAQPGPKPVTHTVAGGGGGAQKPTSGTKAPCNCTPGDPLCSCL